MRERMPLVLSLAALVVAVLGSTPVGGAAMSLVVPRNSVGTLQLKNNAVTAAKVRNFSLLAVDFRRGQLPQGPAGPAGPGGPQGPPGPPGLSGLQPVFTTSAIDSTPTRTLNATCPSGKRAIGGGVAVGPASTPVVAVTSSYLANSTTWSTAAREVTATSATWGLNAVVICATVAA